MTRTNIHSSLFRYLTILLAAVIPFSTRASTWCILLLALNWLLEGNAWKRLRVAYSHIFVVVCSLFYLLELAGLLYTDHFGQGFYHAQTLASCLVLPLLYFSYGTVDKKLRKAVLAVFTASVLISSLFCLYMAWTRYAQTSDTSFFFYHTLVAPLDQHAVYFSLYVFLCIVYVSSLLLGKELSGRKIFPAVVLLVYFVLLLVLLRSKLMLGIFILYAVSRLSIALISHSAKKPLAISLACLIMAAVVLFSTSNPVSSQFYKLKNTEAAMLQSRKFTPAIYFNEIELRVLLWRFSVEILNRSHSWWFGVSPGDAQSSLNRQIIAHNMYTGKPGTADKGYLNYNDHNQYMETLLRSGLAGLCLLLCILFLLFRQAFLQRDHLLLAMAAACAGFFITESVLERQIGIVPFFFFSSVLMLSSSRSNFSLRNLRSSLSRDRAARQKPV
jgi:O-antigen ligase